MKNFKWGIIGTGGIAKAFAMDLHHLKGHNISAVLSRSENSAKKFSSQFSECNGYYNNKEFFALKNIDAVYIATPNTLHCKQTIKALEAKKPVLCEKPFAMNQAEANSMVEYSKTNNTTLLEGMWTRYLPHIDKIRELLNNNIIGQIQSIFACHSQDLRHSDNPRLWTKELGGGALLDLGIYVVSFSHMILGKPKEIIAKSVFTKNGVDAKTSMIFEYENGAIANLHCSMYDTQPNRAIISGDKGTIEIHPTFYCPTSITVNLINNKKFSFPNNYEGHGLREQAKELENCVKIKKLESPKMKHKESIAVMESMDRIRDLIKLKFE